MRILVSWLREYVEVPVGLDELTATMAMCGFQLESREDGAAAGLPEGDTVIDFEVTTNRPDCLSVIGLAREISAAFDRPLGRPGRHPPPLTPAPGSPSLQVELEDAELCPRYAAALAEVRVGPAPAWMARRLHAAGIRPINNVVDVTNYVLIEMGHPMHAFDRDRLAGGRLRIRRATPGERLRTLDGVERALSEDMLVIADAARPAAVAGVMGGAESEVGPSTRAIVLESAFFEPRSVRRTARRLGLSTEASYRFERGADVGAPVAAIERAGALIEQIGAGRLTAPVVDRYPAPREPLRLTLRAGRIRRVLGQAVDPGDVQRVLERLGFTVAPRPAGGRDGEWLVTVPSWRVDVAREIDLVEEVARHHGYDRLPATFPALTQAPPRLDPRIGRDRLVRRILTGAGFSEASTFAFIERSAAASVVEDEATLVELGNPLSEKFAAMRPSLLPGLIDAVAHNRRRERRDVRLFEVGARFSRHGGESHAVAIAWMGSGVPEHWSEPARPVDFFDVKGIVERLCETMGVEAAFQPAGRPYLAPGQAAAIVAAPAGDGRGHEAAPLGVLGLVAPALAAAREIPPADHVFVAEVDLDALAALAPTGHRRVAPLPRHPSVVRDLSILVDAALPAAAVRGTIRAAAPPTLVDAREFARYLGRGVPEGRVSLSFRLTFRAADRTLVDAEVQQAVDAILGALAAAHGAELR